MFKNFVQHQTDSFWRRHCYRSMLLAFALLTLSQTTGCRIWKQAGVGEAMMITYRDMVWAKRAYNLRYKNCDRPYAEHFESGFRAGYTDVAQGGDGFVPALPPAEYRGFEFQSADGAKCVNSWFEGYPEGVAAAKRDKTGNYNDVMISRAISSAVSQENTKAVLPQDVPVVSSSPNQPGRRDQLPAIRSTFTPIGTSMPYQEEMVAPPHASTTSATDFDVEPANYQSRAQFNEPFPAAMSPMNWMSDSPRD